MNKSIVKIDVNGNKEWWFNGVLHRENDLPAVIWANGTNKWYFNGLCHRENGPAIEYANGTKEWYLKTNLQNQK